MKIRKVLEYKLKGEKNISSRIPLVFSDKIFVIFDYDKGEFTESRIQCLNITDFAVIWEHKYPDYINNLIKSEKGSLLASCMDGAVLNLNFLNGNLIWSFRINDSRIGPISNEVNERIVFSGIQRTQRTWCLDTNDGSVRWDVKNNGHSYQPLIHGSKVLNCIGHELYCLDVTSGDIKWKTSNKQTYLFNPIVAANMAIASGHGLVEFYNIETGRLIGALKTGQSIATRESSIWKVIADDEGIYFGDEKGFFYSYSFPQVNSVSFLGLNTKKNARLRWKIETQGKIESIPAFFQGCILLINNGNQFFSIDKKTGHIFQEFRTNGEALASGIVLYDDMIYYSCYGGIVVKCSV